MSETRNERAARDFYYWLTDENDEDRFDRSFGDQPTARKNKDWPDWNA